MRFDTCVCVSRVCKPFIRHGAVTREIAADGESAEHESSIACFDVALWRSVSLLQYALGDSADRLLLCRAS